EERLEVVLERLARVHRAVRVHRVEALSPLRAPPDQVHRGLLLDADRPRPDVAAVVDEVVLELVGGARADAGLAGRPEEGLRVRQRRRVGSCRGSDHSEDGSGERESQERANLQETPPWLKEDPRLPGADMVETPLLLACGRE